MIIFKQKNESDFFNFSSRTKHVMKHKDNRKKIKKLQNTELLYKI